MTTELTKMRYITLRHCLVFYYAYAFQGLGAEIRGT